MVKVNKVLLGMALILSTIFVTAQKTTSSPYSRYGVGTLLSQDFMRNFAMGGAGIGVRSNRNINFDNPASYSALSVTTFEAAFTNSSLYLTDGVQSENLNYPYISYLAFGIPVIKNGWGMSFGLLPYSNVGYDYIHTVNDSLAGDMTYVQNGDGGLTKAYFGNAIQLNPKTNLDPIGLLLKPFAGKRYTLEIDSLGYQTRIYNKRIDSLIIDKKTPISFGVNGYFMFGNLTHDEKVIYGDLPNAMNLWGIVTEAVADVGVDFGAQYQKSYTVYKGNKVNRMNISFGAAYAIGSDLKSKHSEMVRTFTGNNDFGTIKDTISLIVEESGTLQLPTEIGFGFSIENERKWTFAADFKAADWGAINSNSSLYQYNTNYAISAGLEIIPKHDAFNQYLKRIAYRIGARYNTSYITIQDQDLPEYGITFGIGLPMKRAQTATPQFNLGFEYGKRGQAVDGLIEETFYKLNVGITINDRWFIKRKYD